MDTLKLSPEQRVELITQHPLFSLLSADDIKALSNYMYEIYVPAGFTIVNEGDLVDSVYLIAGGLAEVTRQSVSKQTKGNIIVAKLSRGEAIGFTESDFFSKTGVRTATVTALSTVLLLGIGIESFNQFMKHPDRLYAGLQKTSNMILKMNLIKRAEPFEEISVDVIRQLVQKIEEVNIPAGETIFKQGEESHACYLLEEGEVEIINDDGTQKALLHPFAIFGLSSLLALSRRKTTAKSKTPCHLLVLERKLLENVLHRDFFQNKKDRFNKDSIPNKFSNIQIVEDKSADDPIITLKNPHDNTYYQLSPEGWFVWNLIDGKNSIADILGQYKNKFVQKDEQHILKLFNELIAGRFINIPGFDKENKPSLMQRFISLFK